MKRERNVMKRRKASIQSNTCANAAKDRDKTRDKNKEEKEIKK